MISALENTAFIRHTRHTHILPVFLLHQSVSGAADTALTQPTQTESQVNCNRTNAIPEGSAKTPTANRGEA